MKRRGKYQQAFAYYNYRPAVIAETCCKTCHYLILIDYHGRRYYKCEVFGKSRCSASDIRLSKVCDVWAANL